MKRLIAAVVVATLLAGCSSDGSGGGTIDPNDQDPACHRAALAAASADPDFEWNKTGMDAYESNYRACVDAGDMWGG